jgi:hypothetical protein
LIFNKKYNKFHKKTKNIIKRRRERDDHYDLGRAAGWRLA